jgi:hypothetical protein
MEACLDRVNVAAQRCGDRVQWIPRRKLEQQWYAMVFWQVVQRRPHRLGVGKLCLQCRCARNRFVHVSEWRDRHAALASQMVIGGVRGDAVEPATQADRFPEIVSMLEYLQKGFLAEILGALVLLNQAL